MYYRVYSVAVLARSTNLRDRDRDRIDCPSAIFFEKRCVSLSLIQRSRNKKRPKLKLRDQSEMFARVIEKKNDIVQIALTVVITKNQETHDAKRVCMSLRAE